MIIKILQRTSWSLCSFLGAAALGLSASTAFAADPIRIGVIAEARAIAGASIPQAAQMAADEINSKGGVDGRKIEIVTYDNHSSVADSVRVFATAIPIALILEGTLPKDYVRPVVILALGPWASQLKTPLITPGAASNEISISVHKDYEKNKYTFQGYLTSGQLALSVCDAAKALLVDGKQMKTAIILSEDAVWTEPLDIGYEECLPKIGLKVLDHIRFSRDTIDFTPIFNKIEGKKPDVIITGISHVGVEPTVHWRNRQVPIPMLGISAQASNSTFWNDTNGSSEGVLFQTVSSPDVAVTSKTLAFTEGFKKRFGNYPSYCGYTAYDEIYYIADAIHRAGSTDADKLVTALEATDWEGTIGRVQFYGEKDQFTHSIKYGKGLVTGLLLQWQADAEVAPESGWVSGKEVTVWPKEVAKGELKFPSFIQLKQH